MFFGVGAEQFILGSGSFKGKDYYTEFANAGYTVSLNKTSMQVSLTFPKLSGYSARLVSQYGSTGTYIRGI